MRADACARLSHIAKQLEQVEKRGLRKPEVFRNGVIIKPINTIVDVPSFWAAPSPTAHRIVVK